MYAYIYIYVYKISLLYIFFFFQFTKNALQGRHFKTPFVENAQLTTFHGYTGHSG
jgi:hypothetical protein